jgi:hypothetical protein
MSKEEIYPENVHCHDCSKLTKHRPKLDALKNGELVCNECDSCNPFRLSSEAPDKWVVLEINNGGETLYKVFGSWAGGYLDGDRWKMNSGIVSLEEDDDYYYFIGYSGSCYKCHKNGYGVMTSYSQSILDNMIEKVSEINGSISVLLNDTNFMELLSQNKDEC